MAIDEVEEGNLPTIIELLQISIQVCVGTLGLIRFAVGWVSHINPFLRLVCLSWKPVQVGSTHHERFKLSGLGVIQVEWLKLGW